MHSKCKYFKLNYVIPITRYTIQRKIVYHFLQANYKIEILNERMWYCMPSTLRKNVLFSFLINHVESCLPILIAYFRQKTSSAKNKIRYWNWLYSMKHSNILFEYCKSLISLKIVMIHSKFHFAYEWIW